MTQGRIMTNLLREAAELRACPLCGSAMVTTIGCGLPCFTHALGHSHVECPLYSVVIMDSADTRSAWNTRAAADGADEWQLIDSAPHNKTMVVLAMFRGNYSRYGVGWYMPLDGWQVWRHEVDGYSGGPTHWAPLPARRALKSDASGDAK